MNINSQQIMTLMAALNNDITKVVSATSPKRIETVKAHEKVQSLTELANWFTSNYGDFPLPTENIAQISESLERLMEDRAKGQIAQSAQDMLSDNEEALLSDDEIRTLMSAFPRQRHPT